MTELNKRGLQTVWAEEEYWLRQLREEFGGLEYIQTLGSRVTEVIVMMLEARRDGVKMTQPDRFSQLNRLIKDYVVEIPSEAYRLKRFWAGLIFGLVCELLVDPDKLILADTTVDEFSDGVETEVLLYKIVVEDSSPKTRQWQKGWLKEKLDELAESEEVHLQRFVAGLKQGLTAKVVV